MKISFTGIGKQNEKLTKKLFKKYKKIFNKSEFILRRDVKKFEKNICKFMKSKYCVGLNSGTDALLMGLFASGLKPGDEVITTSHTYVATISAIIHIGCKPIFVDIKNDFNIDVDLIEKKISKKTRAILPVHLNGRPCNMEKIVKLSKKYNIKIIEDCAQAFGAFFKKKHVGTFGACGCFSLHPMKTINVAGDGGFLITNNKSLFNKVKLLRDHGQIYPKSLNKILCYGFNSRLDNIHAATANIKIPYVNRWIKQKRSIAENYIKNLKNIKKIQLPINVNNDYYNTYSSFVILAEKRNKLFNHLNKAGIETSKGLSVGIDLQKKLFKKKKNLPITRKIEKKILSLPIYPELKNYEIDFICKSIKKFYS